VESSFPKSDPKPLLDAAAKLAERADAGGPGGGAAADLLATTLAHLAERAVRAGTTAGAGGDGRVVEIAGELASLADGLERASGATRPVARWLRGRAITVLLEGAALAGVAVGEALDVDLPAEASLDDVAKQAERALTGLEAILDLCAKLRAAGAEEPSAGDPASAVGGAEPKGVGTFDRAVSVAVSRAEDELVEIWDTGFRDTVASALAKVGGEELGALVRALGPALERIDAFAVRVAALSGGPPSLKTRIVGPRIEPLVRAAFERVEGRDRLELVTQVGELVAHLERGGLKGVVPPGTLLRLATMALVRCEKSRKASRPDYTADFVGYRALRSDEQRVSLAYTVVELALRVSPPPPRATASPSEIVEALGGLVAQLPPELRGEVVALDLGRVERAVELVGRWWAALGVEARSASASGDVRRIGAALAKTAESKFFHVTRDESALLRFALESRVVGEVFPECASRVQALRARIEAVETESSAALNALRRGRADAGWNELLGPASARPQRTP
jgi:hypothetical protein